MADTAPFKNERRVLVIHFRIPEVDRDRNVVMPRSGNFRRHARFPIPVLSKVAIGELNERFGLLFATDSLRSRSPPGRNWRVQSPQGTFHSPELSPEAAGSNEEHERN
jgi:hypothetical protein